MRCVQKGFAAADLARVFVPMSAEDVYRELIAINQEIARLSVSLATRIVREALAALKAARSEDGGEMSFAELLAAVKRVGTPADDEVATVEGLGAALEGGEITTLEELAAAVGSGEEAPVSELEAQHPAGSRRWPDPGRLALGR